MGGSAQLRYALTGAALLVAQTLVAAPSREAAEAVFQQSCHACHGDAAAMGGVSLTKLGAEASMGPGFQQWEKVIDVLESGRMPPEGAPQPSAAERADAASWVRAGLDAYAREHAGDPGRVTVRRLTSGEYAYVIRDLTGVDIDLGPGFVSDAVGGEGFTSFGDVQFMQDSSFERYLEAAKTVADHAVIGAGPLGFYRDPGMSGFELSAIHRIHDIYREHGFRAVAAEGGRAFGLEQYGKAFYAAWEYKHRDELGLGELTLERLAARESLSPKFLAHIWSVLQLRNAAYPTSEVLARFDALPAPGAPEAEVRAAATKIQELVINWPRWLFGAGALAAGGAGDERALVITDAALAAKTAEKLTFVQRIRERGKAFMHVAVTRTDPGSAAIPVVRFRNVAVRMERDLPPKPLREMLDDDLIAEIGFGRGLDGEIIGPDDFVTEGDTSFGFELDIPDDSRGFAVTMEVELDLERSGEAIARVLISETAEESGRPAWALLGDPTTEAFRAWKDNVLAYAGRFPQTSHGEPTPSDRDPIPDPWDNTYNEPERDRFHQRVKYFRQDDFLVEKMAGNAVRIRLDQAWNDLKSSFEFHQAWLDFLEDKYALELDGKGIAELTEHDIAEIPAEARRYVERLVREHDAVQRTMKAAEPGHLEDALSFAARAWRRPLRATEQQELRSFYARTRENFELDHRRAIRTLLARILVAPDFLYRLEQPGQLSGTGRLNDWEVANRLSFFLWSSAPDAELRRAASAGELSEPANVAAQARRMLADPKARRIATEFFGQWLGFYRFDEYRGVDAKRFPEFTGEVRAAMYDEAVSFFQHVVQQNRPIREMISADYTFLNEALAKHYGIDREVGSMDVELVENAGDDHRGGMLRLGAVLTATSAPLRTSPVKRGDWLLRRVVGTPTPPPPPNVELLPADDKAFGGKTIREQLEEHSRNPTCASCHTRIDPLGFPLEHYDSIGRWRETYSEGQPIDDRSTLQDSTEIAGMDGLIDYLDNQQEQVLRTFSKKLLGYALGRTMLASDKLLLDEMIETGGDATFADLAAKVVVSRQFLERRGRDEDPPGELSTGAAGAKD